MKTHTLLLSAALLPSLLYSADPFGDPFASPNKRATEGSSNMIEVTAEWLLVAEADATALLHEEKPPANSLEWRQKLNSLLKEGTARVAASAFVVTQDGRTGRSKCEKESNYLSSQTQYERADPNGGEWGSGQMTHVKTSSDYEIAAYGITLEVEPSIKRNELIDINYTLEWSSLVKPGSNQREPEAYRNLDNGSVTIRPGGSLLVGISTPRSENGQPDTTQRLLSFVSVRLIQP